MNGIEEGEESAFRRTRQAVAPCWERETGQDFLGFKSDNIHSLIHVSF